MQKKESDLRVRHYALSLSLLDCSSSINCFSSILEYACLSYLVEAEETTNFLKAPPSSSSLRASSSTSTEKNHLNFARLKPTLIYFYLLCFKISFSLPFRLEYSYIGTIFVSSFDCFQFIIFFEAKSFNSSVSFFPFFSSLQIFLYNFFYWHL